ncbi:polyphosphate polymerase domain-containing protein [Phaeodactylibacter luteus]|uniref:Polyphosphate polymerase domain-containing protein n=1 Tax=Phaeodactylibacter luteus TaxID=1564516 RepID=A0A5C6RPA9_9BACT|nr:polyphosphate polymerase domain-containing protein [Phaeodactylibacter luteus]TXB63775.1 polyphosphate polymerase domain-containing protein [Phaeodactylibacter luteus]
MGRYERKYKIEQLSPAVVETVVRHHPAGFRALHPPRYINNLYFDTPGFTAFQDNVDGAPQRLKYRLRWYGADFSTLQDPVLEAKVKDNQVGYKRHFPLPPGRYGLQALPALVGQCRALAHKGLDLQPVLFNRYHRSYWAAPAYPFRLTIDTALSFGPYAPSGVGRLPYTEEAVVVEVKYESGDEHLAGFVLQHLPFRMTKSSKFVTGINFVYG